MRDTYVMTLRTFLIGTALSMVCAWGIFFLLINWLEPEVAGGIGFVLFFLTLFLAIASTASLIGYFTRRILIPRQLPGYHVRTALRQGIWLGIFTNALLFMQLQRLLKWWITAIIVVLFISIEFIFLTYDQGKTHSRGAAQAGDREIS